MNRRRFWIQALLLTLYSWALVAPGLYRTGTNIVTQTYEQAADRFQARTDLYAYPEGKGDWYKYSPFFAAAYLPFAHLDDKTQALIWALVNCFLFWAGVSRWVLLSKSTPWLWVAFVFASMELDISLRYQQVNALLTGMVLLALARYRDGRWESAGRWLGLATNFKVLPLLFAAPLLLRKHSPYVRSFLRTTAVLFMIPALWLGARGDVQAHQQWSQRLLADASAPGLLDLHTALASWGAGALGSFLRWSVLVLSAGAMAWLAWLRPTTHLAWGLWYGIGAGCLLLFSPRTESPTFVFLAPVYFFLFEGITQQAGKKKAPLLGLALLGIFLVTVVQTDLWPRQVWDPSSWQQKTKPLGTFLIWGLTLGFALRQSRPSLFFRR